MGDDIANNQRFLLKIEQGIRLSNNEVIHKRIPPVTSERMLTFAVAVAETRAQYIEAAFKFVDASQAGQPQDEALVQDLRKLRMQFEEARNAFKAFRRAIELGYVAVE